jgi:hypothetical protein
MIIISSSHIPALPKLNHICKLLDSIKSQPYLRYHKVCQSSITNYETQSHLPYHESPLPQLNFSCRQNTSAQILLSYMNLFSHTYIFRHPEDL